MKFSIAQETRFAYPRLCTLYNITMAITDACCYHVLVSLFAVDAAPKHDLYLVSLEATQNHIRR